MVSVAPSTGPNMLSKTQMKFEGACYVVLTLHDYLCELWHGGRTTPLTLPPSCILRISTWAIPILSAKGVPSIAALVATQVLPLLSEEDGDMPRISQGTPVERLLSRRNFHSQHLAQDHTFCVLTRYVVQISTIPPTDKRTQAPEVSYVHLVVCESCSHVAHTTVLRDDREAPGIFGRRLFGATQIHTSGSALGG